MAADIEIYLLFSFKRISKILNDQTFFSNFNFNLKITY